MPYFSQKKLQKIKRLYKEDPQGVVFGLYYGFPLCCIESFSKIPFYERHWEKSGPHTGTGFIPCEKCIEQTQTNWKYFKRKIQKQRIAKEAFPHDPRNVHPYILYIKLTELFSLDINEYIEYLNPIFVEEVKDILQNPALYQAEINYIEQQFSYHKKENIEKLQINLT